MIVTIDGPAGTGKSTVARRVADQLQFDYLDTGAMYRMVALHAVAQGVNLTNEESLLAAAAQATLDFSDGAALLNGQDVSSQLRNPDVAVAASVVAQIAAIRSMLVDRQQEIARNRDIVCEGRDQGTVVFPHAECKFFLTAAPETRAKRRMDELQAQGKEIDFEQLLSEQNERDERDRNRPIAPLKPAADADIVDSTEMKIDEVVELIYQRVQKARS